MREFIFMRLPGCHHNAKAKGFLSVISLVFLANLLIACQPKDASNPVYFVTWEGIGPDKWASIWFIKRHINADAQIQFIPVASTPSAGIAFDIPGADFYRGKTTTFVQLTEFYGRDDDPVLHQLSDILHDIEITPWGHLRSDSSPQVETVFRGLQQHYGRENVSQTCYLQLFDTVYQQLKDNNEIADTAAITPPETCQQDTPNASEPIAAIPTMAIEDVLLAIKKGRKVIFLDARETEEFIEGHIPGAVNIKLREIDAQTARSYQDYDIVVPYCIKDFRGYEMARKLAKHGLNNTIIMQPFGLKGWSDLGLPLQGHQQLDAIAAQSAMQHCLADMGACL